MDKQVSGLAAYVAVLAPAVASLVNVDKAQIKAVGACSALATFMCSDNMPVDVLRAPKGNDAEMPVTVGGEPSTWGEVYKATKVEIVKGLPAASRKLIDAPIEGLNEADKAKRKAAQQSIGKYQGNLRRAVEARYAQIEREVKLLAQAQEGDAPIPMETAAQIKATSRKRELHVAIREDIGKLIARLQKAEGNDLNGFKDGSVPRLVSLLSDAQKMID